MMFQFKLTGDLILLNVKELSARKYQPST